MVALVALVVGGCLGVGAGVARAEDPDYYLARSPAGAYLVGRKSIVSLTILPGPGRRLLADAPLYVRLEAPGLKLIKRKLRRRDAVDPGADAPRFELVFIGDKVGRYVLSAQALFYICAGRSCRAVREAARFELTIEEPVKPE
ncbi:MAG: hypothetical protein IT370_05380 [Deltaproteobacteria bacterium]|nr:hypothetical protein [Deltaproteobacteria bacterium]